MTYFSHSPRNFLPFLCRRSTAFSVQNGNWNLDILAWKKTNGWYWNVCQAMLVKYQFCFECRRKTLNTECSVAFARGWGLASLRLKFRYLEGGVLSFQAHSVFRCIVYKMFRFLILLSFPDISASVISRLRIWHFVASSCDGKTE